MADRTVKWQVPAVDIAPYVTNGTPGAKEVVAQQIDHASRSVGFVQITGHGIPDEIIAALSMTMDAFFDLSMEIKKSYCCPPEVNRGYTAPRSESLSLSLGVEQDQQLNDFFEAFNVGTAASEFPLRELSAIHYPENVWPTEAGAFREAVSMYFAQAGRVARVLTTIFADALGLAPGFFDPFTDHSVDVLRMNNYALPEDAVHAERGMKAMGEHTDFGIVTVLWAERVPGLQVLGSDQVWHDVMPLEGALLVNLGDITARWTNEKWLSTLHRVVPPFADGKVLRRKSAAFFHDGNIEAIIETISSCRDADGTSLYAPISVAEHISAKLAGSRGGYANTAASREADRVRSADQ